MGDEEGDVCRVCRSEGTEEQPLYHPCKCAGSIRFVHQDCLTEWLNHSKKKHCEVCKYPFSFTPIYDPSMPDSIPVILFVKRGFRRLCSLIKIWLRAVLVGTVWLFTLPYITVWVWRFYFWSGESIAAFVYDIELPHRETDSSNSNTEEKSALAIFYVTLLKGALWYAPPEVVEFIEAYGDFASKFFADTFEGQIITCVVVIVFVAAFLLREWIIQNTPPEDGLENDEFEIAGMDNDAINNVGANNNIGRLAAPGIPVQNNNERRELEMQLANLPLPPQAPNFEPNIPHLQNLPNLPNQPALIDQTRPIRLNIPPPTPSLPTEQGFPQLIQPPQAEIFNDGNFHFQSSIARNLEQNPEQNFQLQPLEGGENLFTSRIPNKDDPFVFESRANGQTSFTKFDGNFNFNFGEANHVNEPQSEGQSSRSRANIEPVVEASNSLFSNPYPTGSQNYASHMNEKKPLLPTFLNGSERKDFDGRNMDLEEPQAGSSKASDSLTTSFPSTVTSFQAKRWEKQRLINSDGKEDVPIGGYRGVLTNRLGRPTNAPIEDNLFTSGDAQNIVPSKMLRTIGSQSLQEENDAASVVSQSSQTSEPFNSEQPLQWETRIQEPSSRNENEYYDSPMSSGGETSKLIFNNSSLYRPPARFSAPSSSNGVWASARSVESREWEDIDRTNLNEEGHYDEEDDDSDNNIGGDNNSEVNDIPTELLIDDENEQAVLLEKQSREFAQNSIASDHNNEPEVDNNDQIANQQLNNAQVPLNNPLPANQVVPAAPGPLFNEAIDAPVGGFQGFNNQFGEAEDEEDENVANEDLEGVLEAIGMRGSLWMLVQNSALMTLLIALCLAGSIWLPYIVGKLVLLAFPTLFSFNMLQLIQLPLVVLRYVTDPIVDFIIDTALPQLWSLISPVLKSGWVSVRPLISPYLEDLMTVGSLQDLANLSQEYFLYAVSLTTQVAPIATEKNAFNATMNLSNANINQITEIFEISHMDLLIKFARRFGEFAYGNKPLDKIVCILIGYTIIILLCTWYLAKTRNAYGRTVGRAVQEALRQQGIVLKVAFFVAIELLIFPIICGILLDLSTLPLFPGATPLTRLNFHLESSVTSIFLHWFIGTGFMYHFAVFVSLCREIVRPGVMWFIRNPNDPQFHPIKEILEKSVWTLLKKIGASGIMYSAIIVLGLGSVIYFVRYAFDSILPLRWSFTFISFSEPISDFPLDLLVFHIIVPVTVDWAKPRQLFRTLFTNWWHFTARQLRLTSFMFGDRHPDEEGTHQRRTWRASLLHRKAPIPGLGTDVNNEENPNAEVIFAKDGGFVRAPSFDGVPVVPGRRMLIPVTEQDELLDSSDTPTGNEEPPNYTVVYIPPNFKARVIFFLFLMWFCGSLFCCSVTIWPLLTGRFIFKALLHYQQPVHDLYAFTVGLYVTWSFGVSLEWFARKIQLLREQQLWKTDWTMFRQKFLSGMTIFLKISYLLIAFGIVMPFLFSYVIELYFILPWKTEPLAIYFLQVIILPWKTEPPTISLLQDWALGVVYMKIAYRVVFMLPENMFSRAINEITEGGIRNLDIKLATKTFIIPIGLGVVAVMLPALNARLIVLIAGIENRETQAFILRLIYPLFLALIVGYRIQRQSAQFIRNWMQAVRDEEYLRGRRLHNLELNEPVVDVNRNLGEGSNREIVA